MTTTGLPASPRPPVRSVAPTLTVCVFCGARSGYNPVAQAVAEQLGTLIGRRGHGLVYGAGGSGLMGTMAWAAARHGAPVAGYVPWFIHERELVIEAPEQELHITADLFERKRLMIERADAFIALPGGYGTLDEVLDVVSLNYLGVTPRPLVLLDVDGFWQGLADLTGVLRDRGFATAGEGALFRTTTDPATALDLIEAAGSRRAGDPHDVRSYQ